MSVYEEFNFSTRAVILATLHHGRYCPQFKFYYMVIKGADGQTYNVVGQSQGNFNTVGAAAGIASLLGVDLGSILGSRYNPNMSADALIAALASSRNGHNDGLITSLITTIMTLIPTLTRSSQPTCSENNPVTRYDQDLALQLQAEKSKNALLEADKYTDQKIVEATKYLQGEIGKVNADLNAFKEKQYAVNLEQTAINAKQTAAIECLSKQTADIDAVLNSLAKRYIPSYNVCQGNCGCGCMQTGAQVI